MKRTLIALAAAGSILAATVGQALALDCTVANQPAGAGSVATINVDTGATIPNKPNPGTDEHPHGAFITLTGTAPNGTQVSVDTFVHAPTNAQAPFAEPGVNPRATKQEQQGKCKGCDGKGLDRLDACFSAAESFERRHPDTVSASRGPLTFRPTCWLVEGHALHDLPGRCQQSVVLHLAVELTDGALRPPEACAQDRKQE